MAVFRKRLLPASETFIASQVRHLENWRAVLAGYTYDRSGAHLLDGLDTCCLSESGCCSLLQQIYLRVFGKIPPAWLKKVRAYQPQLVHAHFGWSAAPALALADALDVPLLTTFHGSDITIQSSNAQYGRARRRLFERKSPVLAVSAFVQKKLIAGGADESSVRVHYIGLDTSLFTPAVHKTDHPPRVVFVGRLNEQKGCQDLLRAAIELSQKYPDWQYHIVGDGPSRQALEEQAAPLADRCTFYGLLPPEEVRKVVQEADVSCVPSRVMDTGAEEALSLACAEASASGLPVVAYDCGGIGEVIQDQRTGLLAKKNDSKDLTRCLDDMLSDVHLRMTFGQQGRQRMEEYFNIQTQCKTLEALYDELVRS